MWGLAAESCTGLVAILTSPKQHVQSLPASAAKGLVSMATRRVHGRVCRETPGLQPQGVVGWVVMCSGGGFSCSSAMGTLGQWTLHLSLFNHEHLSCGLLLPQVSTVAL